mmetsp:Transcript_16603/g.23199  ORF Transcript_16603/g.23199 Transcript_16603/m.23199 type:complete len:244 (+) Transcript_16603:5-736(+)
MFRVAAVLQHHTEMQRKFLMIIRQAEMEERMTQENKEENKTEKDTVEEQHGTKKVQLSMKRLKKVNHEMIRNTCRSSYEDGNDLEIKISQGIRGREMEILSELSSGGGSSKVSSLTTSQQQQLQAKEEKEKSVVLSSSIARPKEKRVRGIPLPDESKASLISFSAIIVHLRNLSFATVLAAWTFGPLLVIQGAISIKEQYNFSYSDALQKRLERYNVLTDLVSAGALLGNQCLISYPTRVPLK